MAAGQTDDALRLARQALGQSRTVDTLHLAGMAAFRAGAFDEARAQFAAELAAERPETDAARVTAFNLAGCEFKLRRYPDARAHYLLAAALDRLAALATLDAAMCDDAAGNPAAALDLYKSAAALAAAHAQGEVATEARDKIAELEEAVRDAARQRAWALAKQGMAALKAGRAAEAVTALTAAVDSARAGQVPDAERADLDYALGHALLEADRNDDAVAAFQRAVAAVPADPECHYMLGLALYKKGALAAAAPEFRDAVARGLPEADAARARDFLAAIASAPK